MSARPDATLADLREKYGPPEQAWPKCEPLPMGLPPVPELDPVLLPEALRPWLEDVADRVQCPLEYPAVGAMVALAAVVGRQIGIRPRMRDDWTVVPNLWGAIVGRPGLLKSPALSEAMKPLHRLDAAAREKHERAMAEHKAEQMLVKASAKHAEKAIQQALKAGDETKAHDLAMEQITADQEPPARRRLITSDATVEKLGELLGANPRGVLVFRDELTGWLRDLDRAGREGSRAFYLEAWNGTGRYTYDRIGRGTIDIEAACVSVLGGIQPGPLSAYLREALSGGVGDDGLLQRLQLVVWPDPPKHWRDVDREPKSEARQRAVALYEQLDGLDPASLGADQAEGEIPTLRLDDAAYELFRDWRAKLEARLRSGDEQPAFESALSKQRSLVPSLALLTHLADEATGPVSEAAMLTAIGWTEYLEAHARRLYAPALDPALHVARELDRHIRAGDLEAAFQAREVYRKGWRLLDRLGTEDALEYLAELGRVVPQEMDAGPSGGRPSIVWHVHPDLRRD